MQQAIENALSDLLVTVSSKIEERSKNAPYQYIKTILATRANKGTLNDVFDRHIERCLQSIPFMDTSTRRALSQPRLTRPVANFVRSHMERTVEAWRIPAKAKVVLPSKLSDPWPQLSFLLPSSNEEARKKHCRAPRTAQACNAN